MRIYASPLAVSTGSRNNERMRPKRAVILLSGGLDSATTLAIAQSQGFSCHCMSFRYGQRHAVELQAAGRVAHSLGADAHRVVEIDLAAFGGSALTEDIPVPSCQDTPASGEPSSPSIPITYVPARNTIFLAYALAWAEVLCARDIFIGVNAVDYSGYPDCRPEFIQAFELAGALGTRAGVQGRPIRIHTPLIDLPKAEIIRRGADLGVDYALTHSCYDPTPEGFACGKCDSCCIRRKGFEEAGIADPTPYFLCQGEKR